MIAHVAGWEPYSLHNLAHVLQIPHKLLLCTTVGEQQDDLYVDDLDHDLSEVWTIEFVTNP